METKDDFYFRHIIKHDLLRPLFSRLQQFGTKDSMVCSAFIDMVEFIRAVRLSWFVVVVLTSAEQSNLINCCCGWMCSLQENIKSMIAYIIEKYSDTFHYITHVDTFEKLRLKHDQNIETEKALEHARHEDVA